MTMPMMIKYESKSVLYNDDDNGDDNDVENDYDD